MEHGYVWPVGIALYLFLAGVSSGAYAASLVAGYLGERYRQVRRLGAFIAPWPILVGLILLVVDLGSPLRFWMLLVKVNPRSVMSMGVFLITLFSILSVLYAWHLLYEEKKVGFTLLSPGLLKLNNLAGLPLAVAVGTYTAFLLNASIAITLWNNGVLPLIFLASSLSTGVAAVMVAVALSDKWDNVADQVTNLGIADAVLVALEMFALAAYVWGLHVGSGAEQAALGVLNAQFGIAFWGGVWILGLLTPLFMKVFGGRTLSRVKPVLSGLLVITGGLILRVVIVLAGQAASPLY